MTTRILQFCFYSFAVLILLLNVPLTAQDVRDTLFEQSEQAMQAALDIKADILSPANFKQAMAYYQDADRDYRNEKNLEDIRKKLRAATVFFQKAGEASRLAEITLQNPIKARSDALDVKASDYSVEIWRKAEEKFIQAAEKLEDGDVNEARRRGAEAEALYRKAELESIKASYLQETWNLLQHADKWDVDDRAPKTLQNAKKLAAQAEKELNENRYDTDVARSLARQAKYEAKHAIYLSNTINTLKKEDYAHEDLLLMAEEPVSKIAAAMDMNAEFDQGFEKPVGDIVAYIQTYQDSAAKLSQLLIDREAHITTLYERIAEVEDQLGAVAQQQSELKERLDAQAKVREQFQIVEKIFSRAEARVLRDGDDIIIRLVGLNFAVGKSLIEPRYFSLLTKVQNAINTFPGCSVTVEGHTDSFGGDQMNLQLSQERADAIQAYLLANMQLDRSRIRATGYGESQPIANNETAEGREKNRRIDLIIHPVL